MSSPDTPEHDLADELLSVTGPARGDRLRPLLLAQTAAVVRRRRIVRRLGLIAALAGCYLAGLVTAQGWNGASIRPDASVVEQKRMPEGKPREGIRPMPKRPQSPEIRPRRPVERLRGRSPVIARADFEQMRRVSDRFLYKKGDIATALHYGTRALNQAAPEELAISVEEDSFLLMALKLARKKESQDDDRGP